MAAREESPPEVRELFETARRLTESIPRKHHLVPASYLARWAEAGQIRVTMVDEKRDFLTSPTKAARETDFYRLSAERVDPEDTPPLVMELLLGHVEQWGKNVIGQLLAEVDELAPQDVANFAWFLAMQFTRGASMRAELRAMANEWFKLRYTDMTDEQMRLEILRRGGEPSSELVASSRRLFDDIRDGSAWVSPHDGALVAQAAKAASAIGEHFLCRTWVVFETPKVMITCDEPVVLIGGPDHDRAKRAGVATAGVVVLPLDPSHVLVMFRDDVATSLGGRFPPTYIGRGQLDDVEAVQLCREIAMNATKWAFERPAKRIVTHLHIPARPEAFSVEAVGPLVTDERRGVLYRNFKRTRWANASGPAPWPVARWWR